MTVRRYKLLTQVASFLSRKVPANAIISIADPLPSQLVDIDVLAGTEDDVDEAMLAAGYAFQEATPAVTLNDAAAAALPTVNAGASIFGSEFIEASDESVSTTTATSYQNKIVQSVSLIAGHKYRVEWYYNWNYDNSSTDFLGLLTLDGDVFGEHVQEPKDSGGSFDSTGTNQKHVTSGFAYYTPSSDETVLVELAYKSSNSSYKASIWAARIALWRVG